MEPRRINHKTFAAQISGVLKEKYGLKIPTSTIQTVLQAMEDCVTHNLLAHNRIVLYNFVTFETARENGRTLNLISTEDAESLNLKSVPKVKFSRTYKRRMAKILHEQKTKASSE